MRSLPVLIVLPGLLAMAGCCHRTAGRAAPDPAVTTAGHEPPSPAAPADPEPRWRKAMDDGYAAMEAGEHERALAAFEQALALAPACADADLCRAVSGDGAGRTLADLGRFAEAESRLGGAVAIIERTAGPEAPALANELAVLAAVQASAGHSDLARAGLERALAIMEKSPGVDPKDQVQALHVAIALDAQTGRLEHAIALNRQAIAIIERTLGPQDPNLLTALANCAALLRQNGQGEEAELMQGRIAGLERR